MTKNNVVKALRYRWLIFWILAFGYVLVYFHRQCTAVLANDMMKDLKTTGSMIGLLGAFYFYPYALMQLPAGLLSDSWGPRRTITLFFFVAFLGSVIMGLSQSIIIAIFGRLLVGIGIAMLFVPAMKIMSGWFKKSEFATMTGILMAMGGIGSMSSAYPLALLSNAVGWRNSFTIVGVFTLILVVLVWFFIRDKPSDKGWKDFIDNEITGEKIPLKQGMKTVLKEPAFWFFGIWFFFSLAIFFSFAGLWGGPYLMDVYHLKKTHAGYILSMFSFGMIIGSPLLSFLSNKILKSRKRVIQISSFVTLIFTGVFVFITGSLSILSLYIMCFILGISSSAIVVIAFTSVKELFPVNIAGTSIGLVNLFPFAGGAVFQQILGVVLEKHGKIGNSFKLIGYKWAFVILFACAFVAVIFSFLIKETFTETHTEG